MLMNVELEFSPISQPIIPVQALEYSGSKRFVYLVNEDNRVSRTEVTLGDRINEQVAITSGIDIGDRVVVTGTVNMRDGLLVKDISASVNTAKLGE
jgi:multidrug efflux pump subunit AcrA (membrane-fusion protein)